jgi:FkbM family methyltransferase
MPAEHTLVPILAEHPNFNRPLALAAEVLMPSGRPLAVIDVGANIGETVAVIEQANAGRCAYLCIEPEPDLAEMCRRNFADVDRLLVVEQVVGDREDLTVVLEDNGRANPSVRSGAGAKARQIHTLDKVAAAFTENHGVDLIKTDTEGYDFSVLRSAAGLLRQYSPALYFEWYPELLLNSGESPGAIFSFLRGFGYHQWVVFAATGELYFEFADPEPRALDVLARVAQSRKNGAYFDIFGTCNARCCRALADASLG